MASEIVCPHCQTRYPPRPDLYGRRVACKTCKQAFTPEAPVVKTVPAKTSASEIVCPHCQTRYPARADLYGRRVACKTCKQAFTPEAPAEPAGGGDYGLGNLLDEAISESVRTERVEREPFEAEPKPKKKKKKKKKGGFSFPSLSEGLGTQHQIIAVLLTLGVPSGLALLTGAEALAGIAMLLSGLCIIVSGLWALWLYCSSSENGVILFVGSLFCGPLAAILMIVSMISAIDEHPQVPLAYFGGIATLVAVAYRFMGVEPVGAR